MAVRHTPLNDCSWRNGTLSKKSSSGKKFLNPDAPRQLYEGGGDCPRPAETKSNMLNENGNSAGVLEPEQHSKTKPQHIDVAVITTGGTWPETGFDNVPIHQPVKVQLQCAVKELKITDTTNWVAKVGNRELNIDQSYEENKLSGRVEIDYGPREGGGGNE